MDNRDIQFLQGTPINRLFFALNHYISTADHIGEGIALPVGGSRVKILVPYNPRELEDADNFRRLVARTDEIADSIPGIRRLFLVGSQ